jgi:hypothetical protein
MDVRSRLNAPEVVALAVAGCAWPRALLGETPIPDGWMGLVLKRDGRRWFKPSGDDPRPAADDTLVLVRNKPLTVPVEVRNARAADGHGVDAQVELLLRPTARDDELAAFHASLLGEGELRLDGLVAAVATAGAPRALCEFVAQRSAAAAVRDDARDALLVHLREALKGFLFAAGLELQRLGRVTIMSETLAREEQRQRDSALREKDIAARSTVEQAALAATQRRLEGLADVFAKLKAAAPGDSSRRWHELLPALTPGERSRLLENLWRVTPDRATATAIVVVAGHECAWLEPTQPERVTRRVRLPEQLGGLRSVSYDAPSGSLLAGAATGVWRLNAASGEIVGQFTVPNAGTARTGFNRAVVCGARLLATHSQLGLWTWRVADAADARPVLQPQAGAPKTIRAATTTDNHDLLVAVDDCVRVYTPDLESFRDLEVGRGAILELALDGLRVFATTTDGLLVADRWDTPNAWEVLHRRSEPMESLSLRRWDDLVELVIPGGADGILSVFGDEGVTVRLLTARVPIRRAWACDDLLVGLSELRDRLVVLPGWAAGQTGVEVSVGRLLGELVQDVCIVVSDRATERRSDEGTAV